MPSSETSFASFEKELHRLVESFGKRLAELKSANYNEAKLRDDFLNPFFRALGWDMENRAGLIQREREVEIESATQIGGGRKRADYLFRTDKRDRFVCEAKKPAEELQARYAFQAKRYAWNKGVPLAVLTDFEELKIYVVGGKPHLEEPQVGEWKSWRFQQYPLIARELWDLLARDRIAAGSIDQALDALPKKAAGTGKGKARQFYLIKPDRTRALDTDFLEFLDKTRRDLASDIYKNNDHDALLDGDKLTEACQRIIDRILFLRICEDRDIDTGERLASIVDKWRKNTGNDDTGRRAHQQPFETLRDAPPAGFGSDGIRAPKDSLWRAVVRHFRALDRRPPTHVPFFNGNLFKPHFTEGLVLGDEWLAGFIGDLSDDESPYLFSEIPVEILGSVYERFLGKVVRPHGRGIVVEEKPEVRKAGGVYYTPRYIVDYIVEQTAGKLLDEIAGTLSASVAVPPHPSPLPPGEGTSTTASRASAASGSGPARTAILPLPAGEGRGEGERLAATVTLKDFEHRTAALRLLDPACGSGSFLIRAFERVCEHWQKRLTADLRSSRREKAPTEPSAEKGQSLVTSAATKEWQKKHRALCWVDPETGDIHLTVELKRRILTQNIYGVDLDAAAVEVTQLSLYLKMLEGENRTTLLRQRELLADETDIALLPPLQDNIKCGNSLIASDFSMMSEDLVRVRAFDWPVQFAPIMKAGGFDAVIGNPPYIRIQTMQESDPAVVEHFKDTYQSATRGNYDIYVVFIERVLGLLNRSGKLGYIVPHKFFNMQYGEPLRRLLAEGRHLNEVVHFGDQQVFEGASTYTCLLFLTKAKSSEFRFRKAADLAAWRDHRNAIEGTMSADRVTASDWNFVVGTQGSLFEKLKQTPTTLGDVSSGIFVGLQTSADTVFLFKEFRAATKATLDVFSKEANEWVRIEKAALKRVIRSGSVGRYFAETTAYTLFPYAVAGNEARLYRQKELRDSFPLAWAYLQNHKRLLESREKGAFKDDEWYRYGRTQNLGMWEQPKLLVPYMITELAAFDDQAEHFYFINVTTGGYGITLKEEFGSYRYVCGLLNSKLLDFFLKQVSTNFRGGYFAANKQFIEQLPIRAIDFSKPADKSRHDKLVVLVDKLLGLMPKLRAATADSEKATLQNAVTATDQQIDALVYDLYGLTEAEIKLVEGGQ